MERRLAIQTNFTGGELSPRLTGRIDQQRYFSGVLAMHNMVATPHGGAYRRNGTVYVGDAKHHDKKARLEKFVFSSSEGYVMEWGHNYIRLYYNGGLVMDGANPFEIVTTYTEDEVADLQMVQSVDVMYVTHRNHPPRKLSRTGHTSWTLADIDFKWGPFIEENTDAAALITASAVSGTVVTLTASGTPAGASFAPFKASDVGRQIALRSSVKWGYGKITGFTDSTHVTVEVKEAFDATTASAAWRFGAFCSEKGYPSCITFHEDRLVFAGTKAQPHGVYISKSGEYENMDDFDPTKDDSGMAFNLVARDLNDVQWLLSSRVLLAGTAGGEFRIGVVAATSPLTPRTVQAKRETTYGCSSVPGIQISDSVLFGLWNGSRIREFSYQLYSASELSSRDLTAFSEHLFRESKLVDWAWQREPEGILWCVREDGRLVGLTYMKDQQVEAWHQHPFINGKVKNLTIIPRGNADEVWLLVERTIGGVTKKYIERMEKTPEAPEDGYYVDCGLATTGTDMLTVSGLTHLAGETVAIWADGAHHPPRQVSPTGQVSLESPAQEVKIGLPMLSMLKLVRYEYPNRIGTSQGMLIRTNRIILRVWGTGEGILVGRDLDHMDVLEYRNSNSKYDTATGLIDGDVELQYPGGWARSENIHIVQDNVLPMNIAAIIAEVTIVDR